MRSAGADRAAISSLAGLLLGVALAVAAGRGSQPASAARPGAADGTSGVLVACGRLAAPAIRECSGIVQSRRFPGVFWTHNDSGDRPRFFAVDQSGALLAEVRVDGAQAIDWEDIAVDDSGHVYLGDTGNNRNERRDLDVYVVDEPDPRGRSEVLHVPVLRRIAYRYPDQRAYPDSAHLDFDCEALAWSAGRLYLLTKHRSDTATTLYRLDPTLAGVQVAERIGRESIGSPVTAADCSPDGRLWAVLSYHYVLLFEPPAVGDDFLAGRRWRMPIDAQQCEGICFAGDRLLLTNEQRDIYCVTLAAVRAASPPSTP